MPSRTQPDSAVDPAEAETVTQAELNAPVPRAQLLSNGRLSAFVTAAGAGRSSYNGLALTRWAADRTRDADGFWIYVRDLESETVWSAGYQPTRCVSEQYRACFAPGVVRIEREDQGVRTTTEVCVAPDSDVELRRVTLENLLHRPRHIELTSYAEVVIHSPAADAAHPAFSKLFVQTEWLPELRALVAHRRKRGPEDPSIWLVHSLLGDDGPAAEQHETDRAHFIGRGRTPAHPRALDPGARLSGTVGNVLDPMVSLRRVVELAPGGRTRLVFALGAGSSREAVVRLAEQCASAAACDRAFRGAADRAEAAARRLGVLLTEAQQFQRLAGALLYGDPRLRAPGETLRRSRGQPSELRKLGITGDGPLVVASVAGAGGMETVRALLRATAFWRAHGLPAELLILNEAPAPEAAALQQLIEEQRTRSGVADSAVAVHSAHTLAADDQLLAESVAHIVVRGEIRLPERDASSTEPVADAAEDPPNQRFRPVQRTASPGSPFSANEQLRFFNGYGGFSEGGSEYVIRLGSPHPALASPPVRHSTPADGLPPHTGRADGESDGAGTDPHSAFRTPHSAYRLPPLPWTNVVANPEFGFLATESGAGYTWSLNSRENCLTPWYNDPVIDPHGEALYVRDEEAGEFWSPTPGPTPGDGAYEVRHGWGYTCFRHATDDLETEVVQFVPLRDPVKVTRLRLTNRGTRPRRLSVFAYHRLVLGSLAAQSQRFVVSTCDPTTGAIFACNPFNGEFAERVAFAAAASPSEASEVRFTADRTAFLGRHGDPASPAALESFLPLDGRTGAGLDPCAALQVAVEIGPGETAECAFLLGETGSEDEARSLIARFRGERAIARALTEVQEFWRRTLSAVQIETPAPAIDLLVNGWLLYQNLSCRVWGRSAFYQSGGAWGFRDQLQDSSALVYALPELMRAQILLHAAHQFVEGDVLHWWHPPTGKGIRTRFSDDLLWLPYLTTFYVATTGDREILNEVTPFLTARPLEPGEDEAFLFPRDSGRSAELYEHCCRAIDRSLTRGAHGLPLMGTGDWNDGMNQVGREGRGESVWLGFFLFDILRDWIPLCEARGDGERAEQYRVYREHLRAALNDAGWDGAWYRRAFYDNGAPLGSAENDECRIDALAQAWAVISGAAPPERAAQAMDALEEHLVSEAEGLIRLLAPAFDQTPHDPGYIKGYVPGVRENGGQYTHAALWAVRALAEVGRGDRAARLLEMLSPVSHTRTPEEVAVYQTEPYVIAADVYGVAPHVGRGGWTWYTGSAGWMFRVALESVLGVRIENGDTLVIDPRIPADWLKFKIRYRLPGGETIYEIEVRNPNGATSGVTSAELDGEPLAPEGGVARIPLRREGALHRVAVVLGAAESRHQ